jgi:uncharacterized membrane protein
MTVQVPGTVHRSRALRRSGLRQARRSHVFGTVILATPVNPVAALRND